jgi:hypothetical protein
MRWIALLLAPCAVLALDPPAEPMSVWMDTPAKSFHQSVVVGNGRLGAMDFGGDLQDRIVLNESSMWSGGPYDANNGTRPPSACPRCARKLFAGDIAGAEAILRKSFSYPPRACAAGGTKTSSAATRSSPTSTCAPGHRRVRARRLAQRPPRRRHSGRRNPLRRRHPRRRHDRGGTPCSPALTASHQVVRAERRPFGELADRTAQARAGVKPTRSPAPTTCRPATRASGCWRARPTARPGPSSTADPPGPFAKRHEARTFPDRVARASTASIDWSPSTPPRPLLPDRRDRPGPATHTRSPPAPFLVAAGQSRGPADYRRELDLMTGLAVTRYTLAASPSRAS